MQSADYVPGVSGWKIHDHVRLELNEGNRRVHAEVKMITTAGPGQTNDQAALELSKLLKSYTPAEAPAVTALTSRITGEASARADADMALATRIGSVQCFMNAPAELHVKPEEAVEPLRMGKVVFHGETARAIRDAQAVLKSAGVGQLEVVKRETRKGSPFLVVDGQAFIAEAEIKSAAPFDAGQLLDEIAKQITRSELGADLDSRITQVEKTGSNQGAENRALHGRLAALERELAEIKRPRFGGWPGTVLYARAADTPLASATHQPKSE